VTARCDRTDLLIDQCACPQHRGDPTPDREPVETVGQPFPARYPGECVGCGGRIAAGDKIVRAADEAGWIHADQRECS
jgi:hypothetical protein